jgi:predicted nucleotidyltransferase
MEEKKPSNLANVSTAKKYEPITNIPGVPMTPMTPMNPGAPSKADIEKAQAEFEKLKAKLDDLRKKVVKKYKFTMAMAILPGNACPLFEDDEGLPKEVVESKPIHMVMIVPEEEFKNIPKIKPEVLKLIKETKENIWLHIKTPVDIWNYGLDSKFEMLDALSASFPVFDTGFLGALRVASIHKSLVLRKFEKYVSSYFIAGSLVRGTADKDSDVDVFVVIDDTDVKRMPRMELLEKLRGIIYDYIREATALAGVKNILNVQVSLLTDFWQRVRDVEPVAFTFIRDGIPLYDRGTFIPWKLLLLSGRIKPSTEAIDLYMKQADQTEEFVKRRLMDSMVDIYYGIVTPTQALIMLAGETPPVPKVIAQEARKMFFEKEKIMSEEDLKVIEKAVYLFKQYEYGKLKEYPGKDIDIFLKECLEYNKRLKDIRKKIEKRMQEKTSEELYDQVFVLLKTFFGNKSQSELVKEFENKLIAKGKIRPRFKRIVREIESNRKKIKLGKLNSKEVDSAKKDAIELINDLTEYAQRSDLIKAEKGTMQLLCNGRKAELVLFGKDNFIIEGPIIKRIIDSKLVPIKKEEFDKAFADNKGKLTTQISVDIFKTLEKELGHFEIVF